MQFCFRSNFSSPFFVSFPLLLWFLWWVVGRNFCKESKISSKYVIATFSWWISEYFVDANIYTRCQKKKRTTKLVYSAVVKIMKNSFDYECVVKTKCTDFSHFILIVYFGLAFRIERGSCVFASDGETIVEKSTKRVIIFPSLTPFRHLLFLEWLSWRCLYLFVHTRTYVLAYLAFFSLHLHLCLQA